MKINVIGGAGFIGTRLVAYLQQDDQFNISILDVKNSLDFPSLSTIVDVRLVDELQNAIEDGAVLINLAAEHRDDVRPRNLYDEVNVNGAHNVCVAARAKAVKTIVFTSTVAVYGFAPIGTDETGEIQPFNDYGRTKYEAEKIYRAWQAEQPDERTLIILRPTVVFGEQNRGNVYNLLRQIAAGRFVMVGHGKNRKSMAYVGNLVAFIAFTLGLPAGVHTYNFVDKPDFTMNDLVSHVNRILGRPSNIRFRLPYMLGFSVGKIFDAISALTGKTFPISSIRVKKFCSNSVYNTAVDKTGFFPPVPLVEALEKTVRHEFIEHHEHETLFYTE
jgi:nucleoside-diphosphate-sugar epimerase